MKTAASGVEEREGLRCTSDNEATIFFSAGLRIFFLLLTRIDDDMNKRAGKKQKQQ